MNVKCKKKKKKKQMMSEKRHVRLLMHFRCQMKKVNWFDVNGVMSERRRSFDSVSFDVCSSEADVTEDLSAVA